MKELDPYESRINDHERENQGETRKRYSVNWKEKRKREVHRQIFLLVAVLLILIIGAVLLRLLLTNSGRASSESDDNTAQAKEDDEVINMQFENILDDDNAELTITWDEPIMKSTFETINADLLNCIESLSMDSEEYTTGFLLYDLNTGGGISYRADEIYYSASAIKGPYVAWVVQTYPDAAVNMYSNIANVISWSSNRDYYILINTYGKSGFDSWTTEIGCPDVTLSDGSFSAVSARDLTRLWINIYDYFTSGQENSDTIRDLFVNTEQSYIYETLGSEYTVYSKAGWLADGDEAYYNVQNDAGIVMKDDHPYILVVLSDAYGQNELLGNLVECLDQAHSSLIGLDDQNSSDVEGESGTENQIEEENQS